MSRRWLPRPLVKAVPRGSLLGVLDAWLDLIVEGERSALDAAKQRHPTASDTRLPKETP